MSSIREALETLGHPVGALPEPRRLAELFARFQAQVPLRRTPRVAGPGEILSAWLEDGAGCDGDRRTEAFEALAKGAGFEVEGGLARAPTGECRRVLFTPGGRALLDLSFPLPSALSLDPREAGAPTGYGTLSVRPSPDGALELHLEARGDERLLYRLEPAGAPSAARELPDAGPLAGEHGSLPAAAPPPSAAGLFRLFDDRVLRWLSGVLEVSDAWSRFRCALPASDVEGLEALFGAPLPLLEELDGRQNRFPGPTLAAYHASRTEPAALRGLLADPASHASLLPAGWTVERVARHEDGFEWSLAESGTPVRRERVTVLSDGIAVEADGPLAPFRTRMWRLEPRRGGTRLRLLATLRDPVPPRGLPEGTRRRLVFELASELLALDRVSAKA